MLEPGVLPRRDEPVDLVLERRNPGRVVLVGLPGEVDEILPVFFAFDRANSELSVHAARLTASDAKRQLRLCRLTPATIFGEIGKHPQFVMTDTALLDRTPDAVPAQRAPLRVKDDAAMLKAAASLTRDLNVPRATIYWADMLGSALLGYAALFAAMFVKPNWLALGIGLVAVLALYRAGSFIHELTHIKKGAVKGFRFTWNLIVGVPLLIPSFMYEGVHNQHHAKRYYGTVDDPEYLPLALMHPWTLPVFLIAAALAPIGVLIRFGFLAPLSMLSPKLRSSVVGRYSGLQINPNFVRPKPEGEFARDWAWQEAACSAWAIALLTMVATGIIPLRDFLIFLGVSSGVMFLNQV